MTVRVNKSSFNIREKLSELERPIGLKGSELMRAETVQDARDLVSAGRRNLIINGDMKVAQRGTSSTSTGYRTVDRIQCTHAQITQTQTQQSLTSGDPYDEGLRYFFRVQNTSVSSNSTAISEISYRIEGQDINQSGWNFKSGNSYLTVSFWVRSSLAGTYYLWLNSPETSAVGYYRIPFTLSSNTWTKITHSIPGNSGITIDNDNGTGLILYWIPYYGTDYTGSTALTEQWSGRTGNDYLPDFVQNWCNTASATFDITGVQLEVGKNATEFEHRSYGEELALCQRYFQAFGYGSLCWVSPRSPQNSYTQYTYGSMKLKTTMRATPTIGVIGSSFAGVRYNGSGYSDSALANPSSNITLEYAGLDCVTPRPYWNFNWTVNDLVNFVVSANDGSALTFSAEL